MNYDITPQLLREIAGYPVSKRIVEHLSQYLPTIMDEYGINTKLRIAHFLAQIAHESDHFRTLTEYASGQAYEGRRDLGNIYRGDGRRYRGRGVIQLTGRYNYRKYGKLLGLDLENNPELAADPEVSLRTAAEFWKQNNLNRLADNDDVRGITRRINGGYNGLNDRTKKLVRAKRFLKYIAATTKPATDYVTVEPDINLDIPNVAPEENPIDISLGDDIVNVDSEESGNSEFQFSG